MKSSLKWAFAGIGTAILPILLAMPIAGKSDAQVTANDGVAVGGNVGGDINNNVNNTTLNFTLPKGASESEIAPLMDILKRLIDSGQANFTQSGLDALLQETAPLLTDEPLTRNVINERQFRVNVGKTHSIFGSSNRVTVLNRGCLNTGMISITFNKEKFPCFGPGDSVPFSYEGQNYELVFDGSENRKAYADFTIYPIN